ncbi:MAG: Na/Pi cotransporter family protein [Bacteroidales bacterium]|nr:Na/Pi cotransporter family protein [Bacteroidales bacterium]
MDYTILDFLCLLGAVCLFLYGMKVMSEGLQKAAGDRMRNILSAMTRNRLTGLMTGFFITALIQSSSASIVLVVSFVNAGLMTLSQSMAVIFGANLGTTFTTWVISLLGFKVDISAFAIPLLAVAVPLLFSKKGRTKSIGEFIIGFALLFMGLAMISQYVPDLQKNPDMFAFLQRYASMGFTSVLIFWLVGVVVTMVIQSSAATFAICLVMFAKGWIGFDLACAIVLGSAVGTTITPLLASLSGNVAAKRAAIGHLMFNVFGAIWCLAIFYPFISMIESLCGSIGLGDPNGLYKFVNHLQQTDPDIYNNLFNNTLPAEHPRAGDLSIATQQLIAMQASASICLSLFYTVYKFINLSIMIWFTRLYVRIVEWIVPARKKSDDEFGLKFIQGGLLTSSELNIAQAEKEIAVYAERVGRMISMGQELVHTKESSEEFNKLLSRIEKYEDISDRMELEIADYLNRVAEGRLSNEGKLRIAGMLNIISEIESIADCCYGVGKIMLRKSQTKAEFNEQIYHDIDSMYKYLSEAMDMMLVLLNNINNVDEHSLMRSYNKEREINNMRNQLRTANIANINERKYQYQAGIYYMDIINDIERTGDHIINVADTAKDIYRRRQKTLH